MLQRLELVNFRCFSRVTLEAGGRSVALVGPNAAGKTSLLEALYFLARGRSFRTADRTQLVSRGADHFDVRAEIEDGLGVSELLLRWSRQSIEVRVGERLADGLVEVAARLPMHLLEPGVHRLVEGGPGERRRLLDTGVFHVEPSYVARWRRYRRVLKQRNSALRAGSGERAVRVWDAELVQAADALDSNRRNYLEDWRSQFRSTAAALGLPTADLEYRPGWDERGGLQVELANAISRDIALGTTTVGPHRADVALLLDRRSARRVVSRGQQKLLASALVISQAKVVAATGRHPLVLLDDPGAELDVDNLGIFLSWLSTLGFQVIATATFPAALEKLEDVAWFHVKQDQLTHML